MSMVELPVLSEAELVALNGLPGALNALADWHDWEATCADAIGEPELNECVKHHEARAEELRRIAAALTAK